MTSLNLDEVRRAHEALTVLNAMFPFITWSYSLDPEDGDKITGSLCFLNSLIKLHHTIDGAWCGCDSGVFPDKDSEIFEFPGEAAQHVLGAWFERHAEEFAPLADLFAMWLDVMGPGSAHEPEEEEERAYKRYLTAPEEELSPLTAPDEAPDR